MKRIFRRAAAAAMLFTAAPAFAEAPACLKGDALETAFRQARKDVDTRVKEMEFAEAMAPLRAYAIHYWMDKNQTGAKDSLTRWALGGCALSGCGDPPKGKSSSGSPTRYQTLLTYNRQKLDYENGSRSEPPQLPSGFPPGEMLVWADEQLGCDWSLQGIRQVPANAAASTPAKPKKVCPKGSELTNALVNSINAIPGKPNETKAYAIVLWQRAKFQTYDIPHALTQISMCTYPSGNCGLPADFSNTRFQKLLDYRDERIEFDNGRSSVKPIAPVSAPFPDDSMLEWAEGVLDCTTEEPVPVAQQKQVAEDPQWIGYDAARQAGGDQFYQWWRKNFEMRHTSHAFELCRRFGSSSYECGLVAEWTYLNSGKNPYTGGTSQTFNSPYSDYGNNPANAGYKGPKGGSGYNKPVGEPRCYDQGDGTEKCFYD